jgi:hypothetical protein
MADCFEYHNKLSGPIKFREFLLEEDSAPWSFLHVKNKSCLTVLPIQYFFVHNGGMYLITGWAFLFPVDKATSLSTCHHL